MKKNIAYYLEDTSRLSNVDINDLNDWLAEMPYSQPLRLLAKIKEEQIGILKSESNQVYGAYYAEDYEQIISYDKKSSTSTSSIAQTDHVKDVPPPPININKEPKESAPEIVHKLTDDFLEDKIESSLLETDPNIELVNEVNHSAADEVLEDIVENEVLEKFDEIEEVGDKTLDDISTNDAVEEIDEVVAEPDVEVSGNVKYEDYTSNISSKESGKKIKKVAPLLAKPQKVGEFSAEIENENLGIIIGALPFSMTDLQLAPLKKLKKKKKRKSKKNKKSTSSKSAKSIDTKIKDKKSKKKKDKKSKIKTVKGSLVETPEIKLKAKKPKAKKTKSGKRNQKKKVKYLVVNSTADRDFKLNDFDGVSNYTSWLLDKEPVNGDIVSKKDKNKSKKKKKKTKVLKIAADSVKKSNLIISEPLADIMAAQGHRKKAKKMYSQLSLIFPEKSGYFAAKIEKLKKK